jgi:SagB-type dehydrogenase family enzyme
VARTDAGDVTRARAARHHEIEGLLTPVQHPRLCPGLAIIRVTDGILIDGGRRAQVFRGRAVAQLLDPLIANLDGRLGADDLSARLNVPLEHVHEALALLNRCGFLEDGSDADAPDTRGTAAPTARYIARRAAATVAHHSGAEALAALRRSSVMLVGEGEPSGRLAHDLRAAGVGSVVTCAVVDAAPRGDRPDLAVALTLDCASRSQDVASYQDLVMRQGWRVLVVSLGDGLCELGPLLDPEQGPCPTCASRQGDLATPASSNQSDLLIATGLLATELVNTLARVQVDHYVGRSVRFDLREFTQVTQLVYSFPDCIACCPQGEELSLAFAYEQAMEQRCVDPGGVPEQLDLALPAPPPRLVKEYATSPRVALPRASDAQPATAPAPGAASAGAIGIDALGRILQYTTGIRDRDSDEERHPRRYAPTGGDRGSAQAYVVPSNIAGLATRPYFYDPYEHALAEVHADPIAQPLAALERAQDCRGLRPVAWLVLSGGLRLLKDRYDDFSLKLSLLDAGCALTYLRLAVAAEGLRLIAFAGWDDRLLTTLLDLDTTVEPITGVYCLGVPQ